MIKLLLGGSPCTHWSIAQSRHREVKPEGLGWELFRNYLIAKERYCPDFFLYENNKSMAPAIREQITVELGVEPIFINSALVSAQSRQRLYWTNIPGVEQPEDRGLVLRDILESGLPLREKGYTLKANYANSNAANALDSKHFPATMAAEPIRVGAIESSTGSEGQGHRVYSADGKSKTLCGNVGGAGAKTGLYTVPTGMAWRGHANADNPSSFEARPDQKAKRSSRRQRRSSRLAHQRQQPAGLRHLQCRWRRARGLLHQSQNRRSRKRRYRQDRRGRQGGGPPVPDNRQRRQ